MVDTRTSSSAPPGGRGRGRGGGKRNASGSSPAAAAAASPTKRSKAEVKKQLPCPPGLEPSPRPAEAKAERPRPWAMLLAQCSLTPHRLMDRNQVLVGGGENCSVRLQGQAVSEILCILRQLEQGGQCELEVTGEIGQVHVNEESISKGTKVPLVCGDEVVFGKGRKYSYIFQHPISDKVTAILADAESISTILASVPNHLGDQTAVPAASAGDNNQRLVESATVSPSGCQTIKDVLKQGILSPNDIDVTLDNFPYYLRYNDSSGLVFHGLVLTAIE